MCCNIDAPNFGQTPDDKINWVLGCNHGDRMYTVMLMIEMPDRHLMDKIVRCSDVCLLFRHLMARIA